VDPVKALGMAGTAMGRASLGSSRKQQMGKITVHVPYPTEHYIESFISWIPAKPLRDRRINRGVTLAVDLERIQIVGRCYAWPCDSLEVM
jgi:hypothetical protein